MFDGWSVRAYLTGLSIVYLGVTDVQVFCLEFYLLFHESPFDRDKKEPSAAVNDEKA